MTLSKNNCYFGGTPVIQKKMPTDFFIQTPKKKLLV